MGCLEISAVKSMSKSERADLLWQFGNHMIICSFFGNYIQIYNLLLLIFSAVDGIG